MALIFIPEITHGACYGSIYHHFSTFTPLPKREREEVRVDVSASPS